MNETLTLSQVVALAEELRVNGIMLDDDAVAMGWLTRPLNINYTRDKWVRFFNELTKLASLPRGQWQSDSSLLQ